MFLISEASMPPYLDFQLIGWTTSHSAVNCTKYVQQENHHEYRISYDIHCRNAVFLTTFLKSSSAQSLL